MDRAFEELLFLLMVKPGVTAFDCVAGQLVLALFVFVKPMTFYESCLAVIFYVAAMLLVGRRQNVGSRLQAAANTLGWYWPGLALGGGVVSPAISAPLVDQYSFSLLF